MNHASLFSGIGGFDLAAEWMGWTNIFNCEIEDLPRQILKYHFPNAIQYEDIKRTDFSVHEGHIDILTGGFPCQPFSVAGKRLGKNDERHLWPEMYRAIREIRPTFIVGENVRGLLNWSGGLVLDEVYADLENAGYEVQSFVLPAAGINAPHKRDRIFIVASNTTLIGCNNGSCDRQERHIQADINRESSKDQSERERREFRISQDGSDRYVANSSIERCGRWDQRSEADHGAQRQMDQDERQHWDGVRCEVEGCGADASNAKSQRCESLNDANSSVIQSQAQEAVYGRGCDRPGFENSSYTNVQRCKERYTSTVTGEQERQYREKNCYWGDPSESWERFPTQSPVCGGNDGIPSQLDSITIPKWRKESIKAYGNAIVPQLAYRIFKAIEQTM